MPSILVVCSGNLCRSPLAEAILRRRLVHQLGDAAPTVRSAGTIAVDGEPVTPEGELVAAEHGLDTSRHAATRLEPTLLRGSELVVAMAAEHRAHVAAMDPVAADRTFTLKELVRLLEELPPPAGETVEERVAAANERRSGGSHDGDEDVADPIGYPIETYRAIAWELSGWIERLVDGIFGSNEVESDSPEAAR